MQAYEWKLYVTLVNTPEQAVDFHVVMAVTDDIINNIVLLLFT